MGLPRPTTVTEKYLAAIHKEIVAMNQSDQSEKKPEPEKTEEQPTELSGVERHKCDLCGKTFKTAASLKTHKTRVHNGRNV